jgi:hypothetical protein
MADKRQTLINQAVRDFTKKCMVHYETEVDPEFWKDGEPHQLGFVETSSWLKNWYEALHEARLLDPASLPYFVCCYSPEELTVIAVAEVRYVPGESTTYRMYEFAYGEHGALLGLTEDFTLTSRQVMGD